MNTSDEFNLNLSIKELQILQQCEFRARDTVGRISRASGQPEHSVRYHLKRLEERGAITYTTIINLYQLGYFRHTLFLNVGSTDQKVLKDLISWLKSHPHVLWVAEFSSDFHLGIGICTYSSNDLLRFEYDLTSKFPYIIKSKSLASQLSATLFSRTAHNSELESRSSLRVGVVEQLHPIDALDRRILKGLASINFKSRRKLAKNLRIPLSTLELRISNLEDSRVIAGYMYRIDPKAIGLRSITLLLNTHGVSRDRTNALYDLARNLPEISMCLECFGAWDYEVNLELIREEDLKHSVNNIEKILGEDLQGVQILRRVKDYLDLLYPIDHGMSEASTTKN